MAVFQAILGVLGMRGVRGRVVACVQRGILPLIFGGPRWRVGEWKRTMTRKPTPPVGKGKRVKSLEEWREVHKSFE